MLHVLCGKASEARHVVRGIRTASCFSKDLSSAMCQASALPLVFLSTGGFVVLRPRVTTVVAVGSVYRGFDLFMEVFKPDSLRIRPGPVVLVYTRQRGSQASAIYF